MGKQHIAKMKICITAKGPSQLSKMDNDFEKCAYFCFFIEGKMGFEATINNGEINPVQLLKDKEVNVVVTKNISAQSLTKLGNENIKVFIDSSKLITDALNRFRTGKLNFIGEPTVGSHFEKKGEL